MKAFLVTFKNKPFIQLMGAQFLSSFSFTLLTSLLSYYTIYQIKMEEQLTLIMLILLGCIGLFLFPGAISRIRSTRVLPMHWGLFIASLAVIATFFYPNEPLNLRHGRCRRAGLFSAVGVSMEYAPGCCGI